MSRDLRNLEAKSQGARPRAGKITDVHGSVDRLLRAGAKFPKGFDLMSGAGKRATLRKLAVQHGVELAYHGSGPKLERVRDRTGATHFLTPDQARSFRANEKG